MKTFEQLGARKQDNYLVNDLWPKVVKLRAGNRCEWGYKGKRCVKLTGLQAHHIFGRKNYDVRYDYRNGVCLCYSHHDGQKHSAHHNAPLFQEMIIEQRGQEWWLDLYKRANSNNLKVDKSFFKQELDDKYAELVNKGER